MMEAVRSTDPSVDLRLVAPGDLIGLDALFGGLTNQASYRRWFSGAVDVHRAAIWAAHPERDHAIGLVAISDGAIVGHAALVPIDDVRAEVCFEVAAPWRRHGLAGRMLAELAERASRVGLSTIVADVLSENVDMLAVLRHHGPTVEHREGNVVTIELPVITRDPSPRGRDDASL